jgi:hypothetical protein
MRTEPAGNGRPSDIAALLRELEGLPPDWHGSGLLTVAALRGIARHAAGGLRSSAETGSGRSSLLLSHLSAHHTIFSVDGAGSLTRVRTSPMLRAGSVHIVEGASQITLRDFRPERPLDLVLLDGSHAYPVPEIDYFHLYPHLSSGGLLIVDDIHIPTIRNMFRFLREDAMFTLVEVAGHTAFFRRTNVKTFDPLFGNWFEQGYNARHFPPIERLKQRIPPPIRARLKRLLRRP